MSLATGTRLGAYEVVAALGAGGMGEVYRVNVVRSRGGATTFVTITDWFEELHRRAPAKQ